MTYELAIKLKDTLYAACPVDTGQLQRSIQPVQMNGPDWLITIGPSTGEATGKGPDKYAAFTNFAKRIRVWGKEYINPNYHWANNAIKKWAIENRIQIAICNEEETENE